MPDSKINIPKIKVITTMLAKVKTGQKNKLKKNSTFDHLNFVINHVEHQDQKIQHQGLRNSIQR